ncbi:hypothetical protein V6N13_079551 [Hibiscus sabdariffa]|uniref:Uncharacterized protein n=1 Tax=Hibiscus sabdariffa TaxID=183260 RepID=A0ABR2RRR8_9ROSI
MQSKEGAEDGRIDLELRFRKEKRRSELHHCKLKKLYRNTAKRHRVKDKTCHLGWRSMYIYTQTPLPNQDSSQH